MQYDKTDKRIAAEIQAQSLEFQIYKQLNGTGNTCAVYEVIGYHAIAANGAKRKNCAIGASKRKARFRVLFLL